MRKTRLVILPGARCLHQLGFLLLFLACPTIAFKGQENRDVQPYCRLLTLKQNWLPNDTGERIGCEKNDKDVAFGFWKMNTGNDSCFPNDITETKYLGMTCKITSELENFKKFGTNPKSNNAIVMQILDNKQIKDSSSESDKRLQSVQKKIMRSDDEQGTFRVNKLRTRIETIRLERNIREKSFERRNVAARRNDRYERNSERQRYRTFVSEREHPSLANKRRERKNNRIPESKNNLAYVTSGRSKSQDRFMVQNSLSISSLQRHAAESAREIDSTRSARMDFENRKSSTHQSSTMQRTEERNFQTRERTLLFRRRFEDRRSVAKEATYTRIQRKSSEARRILTGEQLFTRFEQISVEDKRILSREIALTRSKRSVSEKSTLAREPASTRSYRSIFENRRSLSREIDLTRSRQTKSNDRRSSAKEEILARAERRVFVDSKRLSREDSIIRSQRSVSENGRRLNPEISLTWAKLSIPDDRRSLTRERALTQSQRSVSEDRRSLSRAKTLISSHRNNFENRRFLIGVAENVRSERSSTEDRRSLVRGTASSLLQQRVSENRRSLTREVESIRLSEQKMRSTRKTTVLPTRRSVSEDRSSLTREVESIRLSELKMRSTRMTTVLPTRRSVSEDRRSLTREVESIRLSEQKMRLTRKTTVLPTRRSVSEDKKSSTREFARFQRSSENRRSLSRRAEDTHSRRSLFEERKSLTREAEFTGISEYRSLTRRTAATLSERRVSEGRRSLPGVPEFTRSQRISENRKSISRRTVAILPQKSDIENKMSLKEREEFKHFQRISDQPLSERVSPDDYSLSRKTALTHSQRRIFNNKNRLLRETVLTRFHRSISEDGSSEESRSTQWNSEDRRRTEIRYSTSIRLHPAKWVNRRILVREVAVPGTIERQFNERVTEVKGTEVFRSERLSRKSLTNEIPLQKNSVGRKIVTRERSIKQMKATFDSQRRLTIGRSLRRTELRNSEENGIRARDLKFRRSEERLERNLVRQVLNKREMQKTTEYGSSGIREAISSRSERGFEDRRSLTRGILGNIENIRNLDQETSLMPSHRTRSANRSLGKKMPLVQEIRRNTADTRTMARETPLKRSNQRNKVGNLARQIEEIQRNSEDRRGLPLQPSVKRFEETRSLSRESVRKMRTSTISVGRKTTMPQSEQRFDEGRNLARNLITTRATQRQSAVTMSPTSGTPISRSQRRMSEARTNSISTRIIQRNSEERNILTTDTLHSQSQRSKSEERRRNLVSSRRSGFKDMNSLYREISFKRSLFRKFALEVPTSFTDMSSIERKDGNSLKYSMNLRNDIYLNSRTLRNNRRTFSRLSNVQSIDNSRRMLPVETASIRSIRPQEGNIAVRMTVKDSLNKFSPEEEPPFRPETMYRDIKRRQSTFNVKFNSKISNNKPMNHLLNNYSIFNQLLANVNVLGVSLFGGLEFMSKLLKPQISNKFMEDYIVVENADNGIFGTIQDDVKRLWNNQRFTKDYLPGAITGGILCANLFLNVNKRGIY
uniref:Uncharacterized protein n=1 Tax=Rhodnius prolixus TaxID=13249 RepID=T1IBG2_RHOPR